MVFDSKLSAGVCQFRVLLTQFPAKDHEVLFCDSYSIAAMRSAHSAPRISLAQRH